MASSTVDNVVKCRLKSLNHRPDIITMADIAANSIFFRVGVLAIWLFSIGCLGRKSAIRLWGRIKNPYGVQR